MTWKMEIRNKNLFAFKLLKSLRSDFMNWRVKEWIPTAFSTPMQTLSRFKAHLAIPTTQFLWSIEVVVRESCCIIVTWFVQLLIHWFSKDGLISIGNLSGIKGIHTHNWIARCWTRMRPVGVVRYKHSRGEGYCFTGHSVMCHVYYLMTYWIRLNTAILIINMFMITYYGNFYQYDLPFNRTSNKIFQR